MERRRCSSRILSRSSLQKGSRAGRRTIPTLATDRKAANSPRARIPGKRSAAAKADQPIVPGSNLQQHYAFSFQITTDQKEGRMSQAAVEKAICNSCHMFSAGRTVVGGFICEECIRIFIIQNQLWRLSVVERNSIVFEEILKNAV
jgi:hypothetical protein